MSELSAALAKRMKAAAELRAAGVAWARIAEKLNCRPGACRNWKWRYRVVWAEIYAAALAERDDESEAESIRGLRELLRSKEETMRRDAARYLLALLQRRQRQLRSEAPIPGSIEKFDDESVQRFLSALDLECDPVAGGAESGSAAGAK
jgi:hypothetical protein